MILSIIGMIYGLYFIYKFAFLGITEYDLMIISMLFFILDKVDEKR